VTDRTFRATPAVGAAQVRGRRDENPTMGCTFHACRSRPATRPRPRAAGAALTTHGAAPPRLRTPTVRAATVRALIVRVLLACVLLIFARMAAAGDGALVLERAARSVDAWPAVRMLHDPDAALDTAAALAARDRFVRPDGPTANLGPREGAVWMHTTLEVAENAPAQWIARMYYTTLHDVVVTVFDARGRPVHSAQIGAARAHVERSARTRSLSTVLSLTPGARYDVLVRIATPTAVLVPLAFVQPEAFVEEESREQMLQGVMSGLWLFMIAYSLANWLHQRKIIYLAYAGALLSSWLFSQAIYGVGAQYLWSHSTWFSSNMSALAAQLMVPASAQFLIAALDMRTRAPRSARLLDAISVISLVSALLFGLDVIGYRPVAIASMLFGVVHLVIALPVATRQARQGDRAASFLLLGAFLNAIGIIQISALLRGHLAVGFLSLHFAQLAFAAEMVNWLLVLGARLEQLRAAADQAQQRHALLDALAHTDPLTGLHNRRGLERALRGSGHAASGTTAPPARSRGSEDQRTVVFMLDLDGFKPINDRWGHEAGDAVLRQVADRLSAVARPAGIVARVGGDEFVVVLHGIAPTVDVGAVGSALLAQFDAGFDLGAGRVGYLGATIGYAVAPGRPKDLTALMRTADAAMYAGKQTGKGMLVDAARPALSPRVGGTIPAASTPAPAAARPEAVLHSAPPPIRQ